VSRRRPRTVVADDHPAFWGALQTALADSADIIGQVSNGHRAVALTVKEGAELVILDLNMPELNGIEAASRIADLVPEAGLVMFSLTHSKPYVLGAIAAGVRSFVAKEDGLDDLQRAVEELTEGRYFLSQTIRAELASMDCAMFSQEAISETLSTFDREAPAILDCATAIIQDEDGPREALTHSFLAYTIARVASARVIDVPRWLLLSTITHLFDRSIKAAPAAKTSFRFAGLLSQWRTRLLTHPSPQALRSYWRDQDRSDSSILSHIEECRSCHLEWGLAAADAVGEPEAVSASKCETLHSARAAIESALRAARFEDLASAWSAREKRIRQVRSSEVAILIGEGAAREWALGSSSASLANTPNAWAKQFLGGAA
jgi:DNA-binding NarL/FixJ family response regulator